MVAGAFGALPFLQSQSAAVATMAAVGFGEAAMVKIRARV